MNGTYARLPKESMNLAIEVPTFARCPCSPLPGYLPARSRSLVRNRCSCLPSDIKMLRAAQMMQECSKTLSLEK